MNLLDERVVGGKTLWFYSCPVRTLPPKYYAQCYRNNFREEGSMRYTLNFYRFGLAFKATPDSGWVEPFVILAMGVKEEVIGWTLMAPPVSDLHKPPTLQLWVKRKYRRRGVGSVLFAQSLENNTFETEPKVIRTKENSDFFSSVDPEGKHTI